MVRRVTEGWNVRLIFEPGRLIVANAGVLLTRVIRIKPGATAPFIVVDAAMNDLMRPALYGALHGFEAVRRAAKATIANVVGPVCESGDTFADDARDGRGRGRGPRRLPHCGRLRRGDASTLQQPPASSPEVLVHGDKWALVRRRVEIDPSPRASRRSGSLSDRCGKQRDSHNSWGPSFRRLAPRVRTSPVS